MKNRDRIRLSAPAADWAECFPLGNGRIGAMVRGAPAAEIVSFNHDLLWRACCDGPGIEAGERAETVRRLCLEGRWAEGDEGLRRFLPDQRGVYINPFVPFCDLYLNLLLPGDPPGGPGSGETGYVRELDLREGTAAVSFSRGGTEYRRECFVSYRYNAFYMKLTASRPVSLSGEISLWRIPDAECALRGTAGYRGLRLDGCFDEGRRFCAAVRIENRGGRTLIGRRSRVFEPEKTAADVKFGLCYSFDRDSGYEPEAGPSLIFDSCGELTVTAAFAADAESEDPGAYAARTLNALPSYEEALREHRADFSALYDRTRLFLGEGEGAETLENQYGAARYLAISAGRPQPPERAPKAPMNLQGLWNRDTRPAWESDYHTDLNIQMCYWGMGEAGLSEWCGPLLEWAERLLPQAKERARSLYGRDGAVYNGCSDPWILGGCDNVGWGFLGAGAWIMQVLWEYAENAPLTEREGLMRRVYALMLPCARFLDAMLEPPGEDGKRVFPFGSSPEMAIRTENGGVQWLASASVCDLTLTRELFGNLRKARELLGIAPERGEDFDPASVKDFGEADSVGEWILRHEENEPGHRHRSPFVCFCPGDSITKEKDPALVRALSDLLDRRLAAGGGMSTSFSHVWDAQILSRLGRGEEAYGRLRELFRIHLLPNGLLTTNDWEGRGGIGWFSGVKVVQLDASMGLIPAVTELFYQDREDLIELLPACPAEFSSGRMTGVRGRKGFVTDFSWENGRVSAVSVLSLEGNPCVLRSPGASGALVDGEKRGEGECVCFPTSPGRTYSVVPVY